jgi:hypothetical protein
MSEKPLTTSRPFELTFYGLHRNQQLLAGLLLIPLFSIYIIGNKFMPWSYHTVNTIAEIVFVIEALIFFYIGRSETRLYKCERFFRFMGSLYFNTDSVEKYAEGGLKRAQDFSHIKKVHRGGYIEYIPTKERPNNFGGIINLHAFSPENLKNFTQNAERMIIGVPDRSVLKTSINIRKDIKDLSMPLQIQLTDESLPPIVRKSIIECKTFIKQANNKSYENYMLVLIPYIANEKIAKQTLDITLDSISKVLTDMKIKNEVLKTIPEIKEAFFSQVTYNIHQSRRVADDVKI